MKQKKAERGERKISKATGFIGTLREWLLQVFDLSKKELKKLPSLDLSKGSNATKETREEVAGILKNYKLDLDATPIEISEEMHESIRTLIANLQEWMEEALGLSAREKMEELNLENKIKFFNPSQWKVALPQLRGVPDALFALGVYRPISNLILVEKNHNEPDAFYFPILNHEIIHAVSREKIHLHQPSSEVEIDKVRIKVKLSGYKAHQKRGKEAFSYLNEIITESINVETLLHMAKNGAADAFSHLGIAYKRGMILLNMIIKKLAKATRKSEKKIRYALYRGYFTGDYSVIRMIAQVFGRDALNALAHLPIEAEESSAKLEEIGSKFFGINESEIKKKMKAIDQGHKVEILPGVSQRRQKT